MFRTLSIAVSVATLVACSSVREGGINTEEAKQKPKKVAMNISSANTDAWVLAEGQFQGKPSLLRFRPGLREYAGNPNYPRRLIVKWPYNEDDPSGMPSSSQSDELGSFEDALVDALDTERLAILAFVFTHAGVREWHFYIGDASEVGKRINLALSDYPKLPISLQVENDSGWNEFLMVLNTATR